MNTATTPQTQPTEKPAGAVQAVDLDHARSVDMTPEQARDAFAKMGLTADEFTRMCELSGLPIAGKS